MANNENRKPELNHMKFRMVMGDSGNLKEILGKVQSIKYEDYEISLENGLVTLEIYQHRAQSMGLINEETSTKLVEVVSNLQKDLKLKEVS